MLFISCKKEISINIEDKPASLVVNSELSSDSFISFDLSLTQNITDNNDPPYVNDASVEVLNKDSNIIDVLSFTGNGRYASIWLKPQVASRYIFRIKRGNAEHWADETMPDTLQAKMTDTSRVLFQGKQNFFQFKVKIKDDASESNYYGLKLKRKFEKYSAEDTVYAEEWVNIESIDFILDENPDSRFSKKHLLFNDIYFKGLDQEFRFGCADLFGNPLQKTLKLELYICSYTINAYRYYISVNEHLLYQSDPFSQPTLLKGNVSNAFGAAVGNYTRVFEFDFD